MRPAPERQTTSGHGGKAIGGHGGSDNIQRLARRARCALYAGDNVECPCCGATFRAFLPGPNGRPGARCPGCDSLERHRLLWLYLVDVMHIRSARLKMLHFAPEAALEKNMCGLPGLERIRSDFDSPVPAERIDITDIPYPDGSFDAILCIHVLEHIPAEDVALSELLRVLKPGGWAIVQSALDPSLELTLEDPTIDTAEARARAYGQEDHVRLYGRDYPGRLSSGGFKVTVDDYAASLVPSMAARYGLMKDETICLCEKP